MRRRLAASLALALLAAASACSKDEKDPPPPPPPACDSGLTECDGSCVDLETDEANCGQCGDPCTGDELCAGGVCEVTCGVDLLVCGDSCVDVQSSMDHCGACDRPCTAGTVCLTGSCVAACEPLLTRCGSGDAATCADLSTDATHCGACASACDAGLACEGGECLTPCPAGEARCGGACVGVAVRAAGLGLPGVRASPTAGTPTALVAADVDGDAIEDLVVLESSALAPGSLGQVEVLKGMGDGTFAPFTTPSIHSLDFVPSAVAVGDLDGDGLVDLAIGTTDATATSVVLLVGDGLGGFSAGLLPALAAGAGPRALALGDLDWDSDLDLVVGDGATVATSNLRVFLNDGLGTFGADPVTPGDPRLAHFVYSVLPDVRQIAIGNFDFDLYADLLAVSAGTSDAGGEVLKGSGAGSFTRPAGNTFPLAGEPTATAAADLDGDLLLDWAVAHAATNQLEIFVNQGASWQELIDVAEPLAVIAADLDGDTRPDLITANGAASAAYFHRNLGPLAGGVAFAQPIRLPAGDRPAAVAVTALSTGETWVLTANAEGRNVSAARVTATGFVVPDVYPTDVSADAVTLGRFGADAWLDLAAASAWTNEVRVFHQARPAPPLADFSAFTSIALPINAEPAAIASGDLDGDGADDLAVAMKGLAQVGVLLGDGAGGFAPLGTLDVGLEPSALLLVQLDDHAGLDVLTADAGSDRVTLLASTGAGTFAPPAPMATGPGPVALTAVDLDLRGCLDVVAANAGDGTISVFRCDPAAPGTFAAALSVPACAGARSIVATRVDADVLPDLVVGCADGLAVLQSLGAGAFAAPVPHFPALDPVELAVADLDGDGVRDLVVASPRDGGVALLRGTATGFAAPEIFTAGGSPVGLAVGAIDGDGQLDVAAAVTRPSGALIGAGAAFLQGTCAP